MNVNNIEQANEFLVKARDAVERGDLESATVWNELAHTVMLAHMSDKFQSIASKIDRLATVVNQGRSWS